MTDLITRLEQAEAGSRELDALITVAVTGGSDPKPDGHYKPRGADFWFEKSRRVSNSVDAITALIGEKLPGWVKGYQDDPQGARAYMSDPASGRATSSLAKTPATAFCVALLRAIKEGDHG
jgi:hypothetical protein